MRECVCSVDVLRSIVFIDYWLIKGYEYRVVIMYFVYYVWYSVGPLGQLRRIYSELGDLRRRHYSWLRSRDDTAHFDNLTRCLGLEAPCCPDMAKQCWLRELSNTHLHLRFFYVERYLNHLYYVYYVHKIHKLIHTTVLIYTSWQFAGNKTNLIFNFP